ncbi:MAG: uroporphyrinogen-III synthase [Pseudomonadota bacterium]
MVQGAGKIWVTRTEPGATRLQDRLQAQGREVWSAAVLDIEWVRPAQCLQVDAQGTHALDQAAAAQLAPPDIVFLLSVHAAQAYLSGELVERVSHPCYVAVGEQTAAILRAQDLDVMVPDLATSEGILQLPVVQALEPTSRAWIMAGAQGRTTLAEGLLKVGVTDLHKFVLYRRYRATVPPIPVRDISLIVVGSIDGLLSAAEQWLAAGGSLDVELLVPSARVAKKAEELGFTRVYNSHGAAAETTAQAVWEQATKGRLGEDE